MAADNDQILTFACDFFPFFRKLPCHKSEIKISISRTKVHFLKFCLFLETLVYSKTTVPNRRLGIQMETKLMGYLQHNRILPIFVS